MKLQYNILLGILLVVGLIQFIIISAVVIADTLSFTTYPDKSLTNFTKDEKATLTAMSLKDYKVVDSQKENMIVRCIYANVSYVIKPTARNQLTAPKTVYTEKKVRCYGGDSVADLDSKEVDILKQEITNYNINKTTTKIGEGKTTIQ